MRTIKLIYTADRPRGTSVTEEIREAEALRTRLVEIGAKLWHADCATGFELVSEKGDAMSVAIDGPLWALCHTAADKLTQHCSVGDEAAQGSRAVFWDQWTETPKRWFVRDDQAWRGVREWSERGALSAAIDWSDDCA